MTPVMFSDSTGNFLCTITGAAVGFAFGAATAWIEGKSSREILASAVNGAISGTATGLAADITIVTGGSGMVLFPAFGAMGSALGSLAESAINGEDMRSGDVWIKAASSAVWEGAFGLWGAVKKYICQGWGQQGA